MKYLSKELFQCLMKAVVQAFTAPVFLFETRGEILHCMLQFLPWREDEFCSQCPKHQL